MTIFREGQFYGPGSYLPVKPYKRIAVHCDADSTNVIEVGFENGDIAQYTLGNYSNRSWDTEHIKYIKVVSGQVRPQLNETSFGTVRELQEMIFGTIPSGEMILPQTLNTLMRSLEVIAPTRSTSPLTAPLIDGSVAAGDSGSGTFLGPGSFQGSVSYIQMAISQDTLGTSPHDSYILILDVFSNIVAKVRGAVNSPLFAKIQLQSDSTYTYEYENGDSVAHWFYLSAYTVNP